jgi:glyoxylase-like metal-dependent hydrolase (beta-lactamase superfamily II)
VLLVESEGLAFIGDIDLSGFGPYYGDATSSLADFRRTLAAVARLDARIWVTSHHRGVLTERARFLEALAAFAGKIDQRRERLLAMLADGPQDLDTLVRRRLLYPPDQDTPWVDAAERRSITMHLEELIADGQVQRLDDGRYLAR